MIVNNNIHVLTRAIVIDANHILLCKTRHLSNNFYFLPGGHVDCGEGVEQALSRELMEELGVPAQILRFLGCLEYSFEPDHELCHNHEYNFVFEASVPLSIHQELPKLEEHIDFIG